MTVPARPLTEITRQAIELLSKEIGVADTIRFVNQFNAGHGNYTEEREQLFEGETLESILSAIKKSSDA